MQHAQQLGYIPTVLSDPDFGLPTGIEDLLNDQHNWQPRSKQQILIHGKGRHRVAACVCDKLYIVGFHADV